MHRLGLALVLWSLAFGLALAPGASASCQFERAGTVGVAIPTSTPPPLNQDDAPGTTGTLAFVLVNLQFGQPFYLYARGVSEPIAPCFAETCVYLPDFNVAFFRDNGDVLHTQVGQTHAALGPEQGTVPPDAEYALVWMRTGAAAEFVFAQGCSAPPI